MKKVVIFGLILSGVAGSSARNVAAQVAPQDAIQDDGALDRALRSEAQSDATQRRLMAETALKGAELFESLERTLGQEKTAALFIDHLSRAHTERADGFLKKLGEASELEAKEGYEKFLSILKDVGTPRALRLLRNAERSTTDLKARLKFVIESLATSQVKEGFLRLIAQYDGSISKMFRSAGESLTRTPDIFIPGICLRGWFIDVVDANLKRGYNGTLFGYSVASIFVVPFAILGDAAILTIVQAPYWIAMAFYGVGYALYSVGDFVVGFFRTSSDEQKIHDLREEIDRKNSEIEDLRKRLNSPDASGVPMVRRDS